MTTFYVTYTVYRQGSSEVISEGEMPVNTTSNYLAEQTVKAMFAGNDVVLRGVRQ